MRTGNHKTAAARESRYGDPSHIGEELPQRTQSSPRGKGVEPHRARMATRTELGPTHRLCVFGELGGSKKIFSDALVGHRLLGEVADSESCTWFGVVQLSDLKFV